MGAGQVHTPGGTPAAVAVGAALLDQALGAQDAEVMPDGDGAEAQACGQPPRLAR